MEMTSAFTLNVRLDNVAVISVDVPGEKMNTLKAEFASQVRAMLKQIRENKAIRGVVIISAKADNFIAGAEGLNWRWPVMRVSAQMMQKPYVVYRKFNSGCCQVLVAPNGYHDEWESVLHWI